MSPLKNPHVLEIFRKGVFLKNIQPEYNKIQTLADKKKFIKNKISELKKYDSLLDRLDERALIGLILLNDTVRRKYLKERLPIIVKLKIREALFWLNDQKDELRKNIPSENDLKIYWNGDIKELGLLFTKMHEHFLAESDTFDNFKRHFIIKDYPSTGNQINKIRFENGTLADLKILLRGLSKPQESFRPDSKLYLIARKSFISDLKPKIIIAVFEEANGKQIKPTSLYTTRNRPIGNIKGDVETKLRDIFKILNP